MWKKKESPARIEKRFEFDSYQNTSEFMRIIDDLSKKLEICPNITFGKNFVSITIFLNYEKISEKEESFSIEIDNSYKLIKS